MKVLVCGGRDYDKRARVHRVLDEQHDRSEITEIIHGGATGADEMGGRWAEYWNIPVRVFPADWGTYGTYAGPRRNEQMINDGPQLVVAFGGNRGTGHTVSLAKKRWIPLVEVDRE